MSRRVIAPLLTLLFLAGLGAAIYISVSEQLTLSNTVMLRGLSGSEKLPFFRDPRVVEALRAHGLETQVEKAGSRQIATSYDVKQYDFVFPAGVPAAEKIRREQGLKRSFAVFFTPMVVASWRPIAELLEQNGIVEEREGAYYIIDLRKLLEAIAEEARWKDLKGGDAYPANKRVLITSTDIRKSNSAAMYLSLVSYVLNGDNIVQGESDYLPIMDQLAELFLRQGFTEHSSQVPFQDYLVMGPGKSPMVVIYEAQFLAEIAAENSAIRKDMVPLYPVPTLFTKHILLPISEDGARLGEALTTDPRLQELAAEHGLRTDNIAAFQNFVKRHDLTIPSTLVNVIEPPSYEVLERMIQIIEERYRSVGG